MRRGMGIDLKMKDNLAICIILSALFASKIVFVHQMIRISSKGPLEIDS